jgi:SAM-dependent methyltransferase
MEIVLDKNFWDNLWKNKLTGWDVGGISTPLAAYFEQYEHKYAKILIPGCGNAYEAEHIAALGFTDITILDISPEVVSRLQEKFKDNPVVNVIEGDYFQHQGCYDIIVEQTFFCAINPELRGEYIDKAYSLLKDNGKIVGLLFEKDFGSPLPPYGGSEAEYRKLFSPNFVINVMEKCYNSITPRKDSELFIILTKK